MLVQNGSEGGHTDRSFTVSEADLDRATVIIEDVAKRISAAGVAADRGIAKVSLIGAGMKSDPGVAADMFEALADAGINIQIISTSSIRISCVVDGDHVGAAVNAIHERFKLHLGEPDAAPAS